VTGRLKIQNQYFDLKFIQVLEQNNGFHMTVLKNQLLVRKVVFSDIKDGDPEVLQIV